MKSMFLALSIVLGVAACGGAANSALDAQLSVPEIRESRVTLTPALDVSSVVDGSIADRLVIDSITINVADIRLLGADPRVPTGGLRLAEGEQVVSTESDVTAFPFPASLLDDQLAVYVRLAPSSALDSASVIVRARLFSHAVSAGAQHLASGSPTDPSTPDPEGDPSKATPDPEGDPSHPTGDRVIDPEGDPSKSDGTGRAAATKDACVVDPEGDPSHCRGGRMLRKRQALAGSDDPYVTVELRGIDAVDLIVDLDKTSRLNVVLGIPAARWLSAETVAQLESALDQAPVDQNEAKGKTEREAVVVQAQRTQSMASGGDKIGQKREGDDYRLLEGETVDPASIRRH
ncbi:MAG: hypothetical protein U1E65_09975 [Myxococcota bacterium]